MFQFYPPSAPGLMGQAPVGFLPALAHAQQVAAAASLAPAGATTNHQSGKQLLIT